MLGQSGDGWVGVEEPDVQSRRRVDRTMSKVTRERACIAG